jgi:hypothetical protein
MSPPPSTFASVILLNGTSSQAALKMEGDGRLGHRQKQSLLCVLPRRERQSVVPSSAPGHTGLRTHGTRREPAFGGGRLVAVYRHRDRFSWRGGALPGHETLV